MGVRCNMQLRVVLRKVSDKMRCSKLGRTDRGRSYPLVEGSAHRSVYPARAEKRGSPYQKLHHPYLVPVEVAWEDPPGVDPFAPWKNGCKYPFGPFEMGIMSRFLRYKRTGSVSHTPNPQKRPLLPWHCIAAPPPPRAQARVAALRTPVCRRVQIPDPPAGARGFRASQGGTKGASIWGPLPGPTVNGHPFASVPDNSI